MSYMENTICESLKKIEYILEGYIFVCGKNNINNGNNPYIGLIVME